MKESISHLHMVCNDWTRELEFYKSEIPFFKKRLEEVASKNTSKEVSVQIEHFENKFRIMSIHVDELLHDVKLKNEHLLGNAAAMPTYINIKMVEKDGNIEELIAFTANDFNTTKKEFYQFLSKNM
ncbi:MAG: hypothetical protein IPK03_08055 [Bacteroidetes bacterium]|nr:hypothetical protein [Bacteroidota bacterium]MBP7476905.1 hypothetical protein [Chitinophagales bacterium]